MILSCAMRIETRGPARVDPLSWTKQRRFPLGALADLRLLAVPCLPIMWRLIIYTSPANSDSTPNSRLITHTRFQRWRLLLLGIIYTATTSRPPKTWFNPPDLALICGSSALIARNSTSSTRPTPSMVDTPYSHTHGAITSPPFKTSRKLSGDATSRERTRATSSRPKSGNVVS